MTISTACIHMIIVWPAAMSQMQHIPAFLVALNGKLLHSVIIHPQPETLEQFIHGIYSGSQYDLARIDEKKEGILSHLSTDGIAALFFTLTDMPMEWNEARGRYIYPDVLKLKDDIRRAMESNLQHLVSLYETIHITDDMNEFSNDFSEMMKMACVSPCDYLNTDAFQEISKKAISHEKRK